MQTHYIWGAPESSAYPQNIIFVAGSNIGFRYEFGQLKHPLDAVKIVLSTDTGKMHAYPEGSTSFSAERYATCGNLIVI